MATLLIACLTACASFKSSSSPPTPDHSLPEITSVPFYAQERFQCGPAALAMMLHWAGRDTPISELEERLYIESRKGSLQVEMIAAARSQGVLPYVHEGGFASLWALLEAGKPVLVLQNLAFSWYPKWHYAVVVGFNALDQQVLLRSGPNALKREALSEFARSWQGSQQWMLSVSPPGVIPVAANEVKLLAAVNNLEATSQAELAHTYLVAATERWPNSMLSWMARGNSDYASARFAEAEEAYRKALQFNPAHPAPPHNLAWALLRQDKREAAFTYAQQALTLSQALPKNQRQQYASAAKALNIWVSPDEDKQR